MRTGLRDAVLNTSVPRINTDTVLRLKEIPEGGNHRDLREGLLERYLSGARWGPDAGNGRLSRRHYYAYRRLHPNFWCWTLNTKADSVYHYRELRALSVREFARIQSFPDRFVLTTDPRREGLPWADRRRRRALAVSPGWERRTTPAGPSDRRDAQTSAPVVAAQYALGRVRHGSRRSCGALLERRAGGRCWKSGSAMGLRPPRRTLGSRSTGSCSGSTARPAWRTATKATSRSRAAPGTNGHCGSTGGSPKRWILAHRSRRRDRLAVSAGDEAACGRSHADRGRTRHRCQKTATGFS